MNVDLLPHAEDVERALLGRLLAHPAESLESLRRLHAKHFNDGRHQIIYKTITDLASEEAPRDALMVVHRLRERGQLKSAAEQAYIGSLLNYAGTRPNIEYYAEEIILKARDRALIRQAEELRKFLLSSPGRDGESRLKALVGRFNRVACLECRDVSPANRSRWSHADLMQAKFTPQKWIVEGLVTDEGLTLLGGKKKLGKSWMCLQIAQGVASGSLVLERATEQGPVIYLCLEDAPRRLAGRLIMQRAPSDLPIEYVNRFTPLNLGGLEELLRLIKTKGPRLLIIDTLAAAKTSQVDEDSAGVMADLFNALRAIAQDLHLGILVVAHHGKNVRGDPGDDIRGSSASPAAADVNLGLYKREGRYTLNAEGRDIEELELRVALDKAQTWSWHSEGDARELASSEAEAEIIEALRTLGEADAQTVAETVGKTRPAVQVVLKRLRESGQVTWKHSEDSSGKILYGPWEKP